MRQFRMENRFAGLATALALLLAGLGAQPGFGDEYRLIYKFDPNQFVHYEVVHETTIFTQYGQAELTTQHKSTTRRHYRVVAVDEAGAGLVEPVIDRVIMYAQSGDQPPVHFDSTEAAEECPREFVPVMRTVGRPLARLQFAPHGELLAVKPINPAVKQGHSEEDRHELNFLVQMPHEPLQVGDTWYDELEVEVNITPTLQKPITLRRTYRLAAVDGNRATIELKTATITPVNDPAILAQLAQRTPHGTIMFDLEQGVIVSRDITIAETVIEPYGPKSRLDVKSRRIERMLSTDELAEEPRVLR